MQKRVFLKTIVGGCRRGRCRCGRLRHGLHEEARLKSRSALRQALTLKWFRLPRRPPEKDGLKVQVVEFTDYLGPDKALAEKALDLNVYQHEPFLKNFNANQKTDLVAVAPAILMRMGIYSNRVKNVNELKDGATVGIPNDPTNGGRGLQLLEKAGLIKMKEGAGFKATLADVVDNPKHLQFKELEAAQLPRSIDDLDAATITMNYVMSAGLDPAKQGIFLEDKDAPLALMVIAARPDNKDSEAVQKFVKAYHSDEVKKFIADKYKGTIVPGWS